MSIKVLYLPENFYTPQNKFLATPLINSRLLLQSGEVNELKCISKAP